MSRYLVEDEGLDFAANDDSEKEEISLLDWIYTDYGKEDKEEMSSCDSSSEEEKDYYLCSSVSANYFVFKTETW